MRPAALALTVAIGLTLGLSALAQSPPGPSTSPAGSQPPAAVPPAPGGAPAPGRAAKAAEAHSAAPAGQPTSGEHAAAAGHSSSDRLELGTTEISGNRELPKVMYVVPWRRPDPGDAVGRPPNSLVEEALTPIDRQVFERQNRYYAALQSSAAAAKPAPAAAGAVARPAAAP